MNKLFVYGIFLSADRRAYYGMSNARYDTVPGYLTMGGHIVEAIPVPERPDIALTGLVVDVDPRYWPELDELERAYNRVIVTTNLGTQAYMYAGKVSDGQEESDTASGQVAEEEPVR